MNDNSSQPLDAQQAQIKTNDLLWQHLRELTIGRLHQHEQRAQRLTLLMRKMHVVGQVALPIPNMVAFEQILLLPAPDDTPQAILRWTMEAVWILHVQCHEDALFSRGEERRRLIAAFWKKIPAQHFTAYYLALRDLLASLEKKSLSSSQNLDQMTAALTQALKSFSWSKPAAEPSSITPAPDPAASTSSSSMSSWPASETSPKNANA